MNCESGMWRQMFRKWIIAVKESHECTHRSSELRREVKLAIGDAHVRAKERVENKIEIIVVFWYFIAMFILYEIMRVRGASF